MQEIVQQVVALLIGSIPTLLLFLVLVLSYQFLVQGPLSRTLKERRARTAGAVEEAQKAIAAAEAKTADYAEKLRHARMEIFKAREGRLQKWMQERDAALEQARHAASVRVAKEKAGLLAETEQARKALLAGADTLAEQVVRAIMPATAGGSR